MAAEASDDLCTWASTSVNAVGDSRSLGRVSAVVLEASSGACRLSRQEECQESRRSIKMCEDRTHLRVPSSLGEERSRVVRSFWVIISSLGYFRRKSRLW